jgi:maltokinase
MTFTDALAGWLPTQRWFSGRDEPVPELAVTADTALVAGDPGLRHLIISVRRGQDVARYQVLVGLRHRLPASLSQAVIGPAAGGMTAYDALHDPELAGFLLESIAAERTVGPLRFATEPGMLVGSWPGSRVLTSEQSNTSVIFGEAAILKVLRRLFPGENPDLEVAGALARIGSKRIAPPFGRIATELAGEPVLLAVLSKYLAHASDGWSLAAASLRRLYARTGAYEQEYLTAPLPADPEQPPGEPATDFAGEAYLLGGASAEMHADLAVAFGTTLIAPQQVAILADQMTGKLELARARIPALERYAEKLRAAYADLASLTEPVVLQRVHGDYHLGQVLRTQDGWVALDFEGEPAVPLAQRRAPAPALRDVAGMLRSFDYAARHRLLGHRDEARLRGPADAWVQRCQAAFCTGYADAGGTDPRTNATLLRALMLEKAVYEVIYEAQHRPSWLSIPLESIAAA